MASELKVNSSVCGFVHKVSGQKEGKNIIIDIDSPCEKIQKMAHMEVPVKQTFDIKDNYVMEKAQEARCSANCLVPSGILHVCRLEMNMLSKSLVKEVGCVSIDFT